ncbi:hypothetical protein [Bdellovibrio sp. BCCA]|uniref:hypothetical protein n=1 Tax=Bdellovibrio sp. BCCA TaxID=3136281 RepID=UPI0030F0C885
MKNLIYAFLVLLHAVVAFGNKGSAYRPMVTEGEIITVYSVDDPKRLPSIEEVRNDLKRKKNVVKEGVDDLKSDKDSETEGEHPEDSDDHSDDAEESPEEDEPEDGDEDEE